jgi:hypothetical protein
MKATPNASGIRSNKPTRKQLRYLRILAEPTASTFAMPQDIAEASAEITRPLKLERTSGADRTREKRAIQRDMQTRPDDATAIRRDDVRGYGSSARWEHPPTDNHEPS